MPDIHHNCVVARIRRVLRIVDNPKTFIEPRGRCSVVQNQVPGETVDINSVAGVVGLRISGNKIERMRTLIANAGD